MTIFTPDTLPAVRRSLHAFLATPTRGPDLWTRMIANGEQFWLPAPGSDMPLVDRGRWAAHHVADTVARARLFFLGEAGATAAAEMGAQMRSGTLEPVEPPAQTGMLLCPGGLGWTSDQMQQIAVVWSRMSPGEYWLTWWSDVEDLVEWTELSTSHLHAGFGPLHFVASARIQVGRGAPPPNPADPVEPAPADHFALQLTPDGDHDQQIPDELRGSWATTIGALAVSAGATHVPLHRSAPSAANRAADHAAGLLPSKIVHC